MRIITPLLLFLFSTCFYGQDWMPSYGEAVTAAEKEGKPIVLVFSGSDWCAPCIKLDKTIWQSGEFKSYSQKNYVLYKADFPRKKTNQLSDKLARENSELAERFNPKGHFPLVVVLDAGENVLGKMGYKKVIPKDYISLLNNCLD